MDLLYRELRNNLYFGRTQMAHEAVSIMTDTNLNYVFTKAIKVGDLQILSYLLKNFPKTEHIKIDPSNVSNKL